MNTNQSLCANRSQAREREERFISNIYIVLFPFALGSFINKVNIYTIYYFQFQKYFSIYTYI